MYVGVDLVKIERWERILEKFPPGGEDFHGRGNRPLREEGKEAGRVLCSPLGRPGGGREGAGHRHFGSAWQDAYVTWTKWGAPLIHLQGTFAKRAKELGIKDTSISISHEENMAIAVVVMAGGSDDTDKE